MSDSASEEKCFVTNAKLYLSWAPNHIKPAIVRYFCKYSKRFAESCHLSRDVNVIHVTINIPFNDKSVPEKEILLRHSCTKAVSITKKYQRCVSKTNFRLTWYFQEHWSQPDSAVDASIGEEQAGSSPPFSLTQLMIFGWRHIWRKKKHYCLGMIRKSVTPSARTGRIWRSILKTTNEQKTHH